MTHPSSSDSSASRREFIKASAAAATVPVLAAQFAPAVHAAGSDKLKVGLIGCGGRGTGAAQQALRADSNVELVALGDAFEDNLRSSLRTLSSEKSPVRDKVHVHDDHCFVGLDAYKKVIDASDVVLLCTPPGFRPLHFKAAVDAGKHVFTEKPMATDAPGVRSTMESVEIAKKKNLAICAGFCWRYDHAKRDFFARLQDGVIGQVQAVYGTYLTSPVKPMPPAKSRPKEIGNLEWMIRNWYNYTWLSGDGYVEQACHTVDWLDWAFGDQPPASCTAVGGRQVPQEGGNIFDHMQVNYLWSNDARGFLSQRQIPNCVGDNSLYVLGTKGSGQLGPRGTIFTSLDKPEYAYRGPRNDMYQTEHNEFFQSIRNGKPMNNGDRMCKSTLMGIMGRIAAYTGQQITWDMAMKSQESIVPDCSPGWKTAAELPKMALPGITPYV